MFFSPWFLKIKKKYGLGMYYKYLTGIDNSVITVPSKMCNLNL